MLIFLARIFLILAAAFGLGALSGRASRRRRTDAPSPGVGGSKIRKPAADPSAEVVLAGAIAGETGMETGGSNFAVAANVHTDGADRPAPASTGAAVAKGADEKRADTDRAEAEAPALPAVFGSFAGSAVSASVAGRAPVDGVAYADAGTPHATGSESATAAEPEAAQGLGDPDPRGPTPTASEREHRPVDALAEKHGSAAFDGDVKSVDFGLKPKPAWPHAGADSPDDGWTVPDAASDHRIAVPMDSPAAFKGGGGAAPLRGAPQDGAAGADGAGAGAAGGPAAAEGASAAGHATADSANAAVDRTDAGGADGTDRPGATAGSPASDGPGAGGSVPPTSAGAEGTDETPASDGAAWIIEGSPPPEPVHPDAIEARDAILQAAPMSLDAPRDGVPDDLTKISGIGPSIERLLFAAGIFHFDQIAAWTADEIRWADELSGFRGRAGREKWVEQARRLGGVGEESGGR
ncbi:hypothetical protein Sa4125_13130 [Aureimonas sp. SA4125]|uniref:hypothetical protein n=1 Tax=Aureimonas sp. SA4125 TaxID=2826993 RepID=UPI001CC64E3C|nr:hypothetical protein [Aureimonas sp. SA4125]BDA83771.1 hypothetical protein Sa4125_13130 [Aureimonas sp. SA4125]